LIPDFCPVQVLVLQSFRIISFLLLIVFCNAADIVGQVPFPGNYRQKIIPVTPTVGYKLDSLRIVPATFEIAGVDRHQYRLDEANAILYWNSPPTDSVVK